MARRLNPQGLIDRRDYLFSNHAQYKDKLIMTIRDNCSKHSIPVRLAEEKMKSGGMLSGSADIFLTVDGGFSPFIAIGAVAYGDFLNVSIYFLVEDNFWNKAISGANGLQNLAYRSQNMISVRNMQAFWNCVIACVEESFQEMKFVEHKSGFLGVK